MYKLKSGYRLPTKDGRVYGNCTVVEVTSTGASLITDFGNVINLSDEYILERFHPPQEEAEYCWEVSVQENLRDSIELKTRLLGEICQ